MKKEPSSNSAEQESVPPSIQELDDAIEFASLDGGMRVSEYKESFGELVGLGGRLTEHTRQVKRELEGMIDILQRAIAHGMDEKTVLDATGEDYGITAQEALNTWQSILDQIRTIYDERIQIEEQTRDYLE